MKDFKPYYELWTTIDEWNKSHESWVNGPFEEINSGGVEELVERGQKTMNLVLRALREKEVPGILKICEGLKSEVTDFSI
jgi:dynein heavy chain